MKLIKRHKGLALVCFLTLILMVILFLIVSRMFFSKDKSEYGDRLNGLVDISKSTLKEVKSKISENEDVVDVTVRTQGKIIYTTITFKDTTKKDKAKEIATTSLTYYSEEVINCYDFEYILTQKVEVKEGEEDTSFTIAGQKSPDNEKISWTKN